MIKSTTRRNVMGGLAGLSLASLLSDSNRVAAAAAGLENVTAKVRGKSVKAALALPEGSSAQKSLGAVMLVHEWWGLNDQIKAVASEIARLGYMALAIDLYRGNVASNPEDAKKYMQAVDPSVARETMEAWIDWLRQQPQSSGKIVALGWCFGGGLALQASLDRPLQGTIVYYGNVARDPQDLAKLQGPVLGQFASKDQWINAAMVEKFTRDMKSAGKELESYVYIADHAFANPTGKNYDAEDARLAWERSVAFLKRVLAM